MALLIDAINKADRERREKITFSLEEETVTSNDSTPDKPSEPPTTTTASKMNLSSEKKMEKPALGRTISPPPSSPLSRPLPPPPPKPSVSFRGALVLMGCILFFLVAGSIYWWITPTSGLSLKTNAPSITKPNPLTALPPQTSPSEITPSSTMLIATPTPPSLDNPNQPAMVTPHQESGFTTPKIMRTNPRPAKSESGASFSSIKTITINANQDSLARALDFLNQRRYREAQDIYQNILRQDPNHIEALQNLGVIAYNLGRVDEAQKWLQKLLRVKPNHAFAQQVLLALSPDGNGSSAIINLKEFNGAQASGANVASRHFIQGNRLAEQGLWTEAQHEFFLAWNEQSDQPDYAYNLAVALDRLGQGELAIQYYHRALSNAKRSDAPQFKFSVPIAQSRLRELLGN